MTRLAKNHDAPHIEQSGEDFIPRLAHDPEEIERRRAQRGTGALILEQQQQGIEITMHMLQMIEDPNERARAAKLIGGTFLSTAQMLFEEDPNVRMRHTLKLPVIAEIDGWRENPVDYEKKVYQGFTDAALQSGEFADIKRERKPSKAMAMRVARSIGNTGLRLGMYPLPTIAEGSSAVDLQLIVRETALDMQNEAIILAGKTGTNPSIAQFVDPYSPLMVEVHNTYSPEIFDAYQAALATR